MKIVDVRVRTFHFPPPRVLGRPFFNSILLNQPSRERWASITQITTDEGITGFWPGGNKGVIENIIGPKLLGEDPLRIEHLWEKMYMGGNRKPVSKGDYIVLMSHVDNALWDLRGKLLGQPVYKLYGFRDLIARRAVDIIQADPNVAGGLTEIQKIASMADAYHIHFAPHGGHIIGSHAVAAFPNGLIVECYASRASPYMDPDPPPSLYEDPLKIRGGWIEMSDEPGLGMKIDERIAEKFEVKQI